MIARLKKNVLFKNTFIYTLLQLVNSGIPFLLLPLLTRYLTPNDYGMIATYNTFVGAISIFIGLSLPGAIGVAFFHLTQKELKNYIGNVLIILSCTMLIAMLCIYLFQNYIFLQLKLPILWLYIAVLVAWMQIITQINLVLWRSQEQAKPFAWYSLTQTLLNISLSLFLIVSLHYDWEGRIAGSATAAIVFGLVSIVFIQGRGYLSVSYQKNYIKEALKFGIPLLPHQIALWMRSGMDIVLITSIVGISQTGLYNVGLQFSMIILLFASAFNNAYSPYLYKKLKDITPNVKVKLVKFTYSYFIGIIIFSMSASTFFIWIMPYFLDEKFTSASQYVYWISLAYAFQGMYLMVVNYIFYIKKTHLLSMVTVSASVFHVVLSYTLINIFGAIGAAYASVVSSLLTFLLVWRISAKVFVMPWFTFYKDLDLKVSND